jgi:hypothetical protein
MGSQGWRRRPHNQDKCNESSRRHFERDSRIPCRSAHGGSSLYLIGDIHGRIDEYLKLLASLPSESRSMALGDLYLGRPGVRLPEMESQHRFITGNHDSPSVARAHPNFAGFHGYIPADGIFFLSGAFTVSAAVLQNSAYWYKDEELSPAELDVAFALYCQKKPRILVSHEGSAEIVAEMLSEVDGNYHEAKRACAKSRTAMTLQRMIDAHSPEHHVFGHYHRRWMAKREGTTFRCLKELEVCKIGA